jgi:hypothetical protein
MKTIVFVWSQKYYTHELKRLEWTHGLGDLLRGTVGILRYCEKRGYECIIDISLHPVSQFLLVKPHRYSQFIQENKDNIKGLSQYEPVKEIDKELEDKDFAYLFTSFTDAEYDIPITPIIKQRIHELLTPNYLLSTYITSMNDDIPFPDFSILHFRVGDDELVLEKNNCDYTPYINRIRNTNTSKTILLSDSTVLKKLAKPYIFTFDVPIAHVGVHSEAAHIKHTLFEFMLLSKATKIYTHSIYCWTSGFVNIINYIYDVPLQSI